MTFYISTPGVKKEQNYGIISYNGSKYGKYKPKGVQKRMRKLSRGAYEDMKGFVRAAETLVEVLVLTVLYYVVWRYAYPVAIFPYFAYMRKYVLMGVYAILV